MNKKELLNEEIYQSGKKKLTKIALIILVVGVLLGSILIVTGIVKTNIAKKENEQAIIEQEKEQAIKNEELKQNATEKLKENETRKIEIQANIDSVQSKIDALEIEIQNLETEQSKIFRDDMGFSDRYYAKETEITTKEQELSKLNTELKDYKKQLNEIEIDNNEQNAIIDSVEIGTEFNGMFDTIFSETTNTFSTAKYVPLYFIGGFIIISSCMISGIIYLIAKRREIKAFTIQQTMPVTQEVVEKMAPTVGNAVGTVAKDITTGIKQGLKDEEK